MEFKIKQKRGIHLDITPVVDTVFNLLIFFALSFNFTSPAAFNINLPEVSAPESIKRTAPVVIHITREGNLFVNKNPVHSINNLPEYLKKTNDSFRDSSAIIQADARVPHGTVVRVMDICKQTGFRSLSIAAETAKPQNPS